MLRHAADLSDSHEYFILWAGGANARPWGAKADAYSLFSEYELEPDGMAVTANLAGGGHNAAATTTVTVTIGSAESIKKNEWRGCTFRCGTTTSMVTGYGTVVSNEAIDAGDLNGDFEVIWTIGLTGPGGAGSATESCYVVKETSGVLDRGSYPQVRVLTPYQPVEDDADVPTVGYPVTTTGGRSVVLPSPYTTPSGLTAFEDMGVFLPLTFNEGIDGFGISEVSDSTSSPATHAISGVTGSVWTFDNTITDADLLNGGYVIVDWENSSNVPKRSWAPITDSTATTFTVGTWLGDGDPGSDGVGARYTAWVPHFNDSPFAYLPGEGFTYPNHDMMPGSGSSIGAAVHNRPRGITGYAYGDTFGAMLVAASRLSAAIGKRVNVVNLGVTDSLLAPSSSRNGSGFDGVLGWWDESDHGTWTPNISTSIYSRLDKLLRTVLPNALSAENSTKSLRCLGVCWVHGESDAGAPGARQHYGPMQNVFIRGLRSLIDTLGYNPYDDDADIPVVQPRIAFLPNSVAGSYARDADRGGGTETIDPDVQGEVNSAIEENTAADEFAATVRVDDLPRLSTDPMLYSGAGEAALGARIAGELTKLVDYGLSFGSTALNTSQTRLIDICNLALASIGDAGQITSLTDGSEQATLCERFLPEARDELLQARQWGFATRRQQMVRVRKRRPYTYQHFEYCYVVPQEALNAFKVMPPVDEPIDDDFDYDAVTSSGYQATFVANEGSGLTTPETDTTPKIQAFAHGVALSPDSLLPVMHHSGEGKSEPFTIEQHPYGYRCLFTNQSHATLQYVARVVDADLYPQMFASALAANLASKLAAYVIKGDKGEKVSARMLQKVAGYLASAAARDATEHQPADNNRPFGFIPDHLANR